MQATQPRPPSAETEQTEPSLQTAAAFRFGTEVALRIENVSKTFSKTDKKNKKKPPPRSWREHLSMKRLRERMRTEPKRVVDAISLTVPRGEVMGILGPNGCGKSTLVRMVSTLLIPDEGYIEVFGYDVVRDALAVKRIINRVSVDAAFFKKLSAMENLLYTSRLYSVPAETGMQKARTILGLLGFDEENLDNSMEQLSRGQQQKVAIARAFLTSPSLLLLDEPTTGLDPKSKKDVAAFINKIRAEQDTTILLTTHDMAEAEALCDRIAILNKGKLVALGTAEELKQNARKSPDAPLPTLEEVFIALAGEKLEEADEKEDEDDGPASPLLVEAPAEEKTAA